MSGVVIVGAQWGDEGKGKVVDILTEHADMVVRYAGGPNAGHTLVVGNEKLVVRLVPSGILRAGKECVLAQGMVVDLGRLVSEMDELKTKGHAQVERLRVSDRAHAILPYHILVDGLREQKSGGAIGTTKRGVGPCYEDKARRVGITLGMLRDRESLEKRVSAAIDAWAPTIRDLGSEVPLAKDVVASIEPFRARVLPLLVETSKLVDDALRAGKRVVFEGAQGTLLDVDHGTYPFVTSSSAAAGGACTGVGIGPTRIQRVIGLVKAYCTRVGGGPFPTELNDADGERLRKIGDEFGAVTGRPRRCGWLDLPALRYASRINGLSSIAITKLDVLTGFDELKVCVAYKTPSGETDDFPIDALDVSTPIYKTFPGWTQQLGAARVLDALPETAQAYVKMIEDAAGCGASIVSVGYRRDETIVRVDPFV